MLQKETAVIYYIYTALNRFYLQLVLSPVSHTRQKPDKLFSHLTNSFIKGNTSSGMRYYTDN